MTYLKLFLIATPVFFLIDMLWLGVVAKNMYNKYLGYLMGDINWVAAIIFYLLFNAALVYFVLAPAVAHGSWTRLLFAAAFFGFITYATYDLTNLATIRDWPFMITLIDIVWGTVLAMLVSGISFYIYKLV